MSTHTTRRIFLMTLSAGATTFGLEALAQTQLDEKDPQALSLGYVTDATKADAKKFPKYAAGQDCSNCVLYQGKQADTSGGCPLFGARQVAGKGWCSAWVKKG